MENNIRDIGEPASVIRTLAHTTELAIVPYFRDGTNFAYLFQGRESENLA